MPNISLSDARIKALKARNAAYDIRDAKLRGFGVRVLPSGAKRFFIHTQHRGTRVWKTVGDTRAINVEEARAQAISLLAAIRGDADASPDAVRFETVAETVFRRYAQVWKPRTLSVNRSYLRRQILPRFAEMSIDDITRNDARRWFVSLRATPVAADRSTPILSVIMSEAERMGLRPEGSNPCRGIPRYRRKGRERFLSDAEIGHLAAILAVHADARPLEVAAVRLLLLTGCRKNEVLTLRWTDYREGRLLLPDSKTGPRTVWLSRAACGILTRGLRDQTLHGYERLARLLVGVALGDDPIDPARLNPSDVMAFVASMRGSYSPRSMKTVSPNVMRVTASVCDRSRADANASALRVTSLGRGVLANPCRCGEAPGRLSGRVEPATVVVEIPICISTHSQTRR